MIQGDAEDKELNMEDNTRLSKEHFLFFCRKNKNTSHTLLGLQVYLCKDLLNPPLEEPPSIFPSWVEKKRGSYWRFSSSRLLILSSKVLLVALAISILCAWKVSRIKCLTLERKEVPFCQPSNLADESEQIQNKSLVLLQRYSHHGPKQFHHQSENQPTRQWDKEELELL